MYASVETFFVNLSEDSPALYAVFVIVAIGLLALLMHRVLEALFKALKLQ